jgi:hypothetical protein
MSGMRVDRSPDRPESQDRVANRMQSNRWSRRLRVACAALLLVLLAACIGGQTTVPTSGEAPCEPVQVRFFGPPTLEATWQSSSRSTASGNGTTLLTIDVSRAAPLDRATTCELLVDVTVELSSDDGVLELSSTGQLSAHAEPPKVWLDAGPELQGGTLLLGETLEVELDYPDGTRFSARGSLPE